MIKHINHQNLSTTPFVAVKGWNLYNIQNDAAVITEAAVYPNGTFIAIDYIEYNYGVPLVNSDCNLALEQQDENLLYFQEGVTGSGRFDPNSDAQNIDGTFKRLVYNQTKTTFYNKYNDPAKIYGMEYIDFPLSKTLRNLADGFKSFTIPRSIFGEKIVPRTVRFYDNNLDDNVEVYDDGYQNLMAGMNLFSRVQEVRGYISPTGMNNIMPGTSTNYCNGQPLIISNPQDQTVYTSFSAVFNVSAIGFVPLTYQWYYNTTPLIDDSRITGSYLVGSTSSSLYINNVQFADAGNYRVLVSNSSGGATSSYAILTVLSNTCPPVTSYPIISWTAGSLPSVCSYGTQHVPTRTIWVAGHENSPGTGVWVNVISTDTNTYIQSYNLYPVYNLFNTDAIITDTINNQIVVSDQKGYVAFISASLSYPTITVIHTGISPGSPPYLGMAYDNIHAYALLVTPLANATIGIIDCTSKVLIYSNPGIGYPGKCPTFNQATGEFVICNSTGPSPYTFVDPITHVATPSSLTIGSSDHAFYSPECQVLIVSRASNGNSYIIDATTDTLIQSLTGSLHIGMIEGVCYNSCSSELMVSTGTAPAKLYSLDPSNNYSPSIVQSGDSLYSVFFDPDSNLTYGVIGGTETVKTY
jgi:hypothetical protein